jgi:SAM-dependent methyltransferase
MDAVVSSHGLSDNTEEAFASLFQAEDRHFWFRARNKVLARVVGQLVADMPAGYRVLEVGCGTGNVLRVLEQVCSRGQVMGMELYDEGLHYARQRVRCPLIAGDIHTFKFPHPFHLIGLFDVLEHLPDDVRILEALRKNLQPGGKLLLTVPAHQSLWSYADEYGGHYRRYSVQQLRAVLEEAGFRVEFVSQFMMMLYPFLKLGRLWNGRGKTDSLEDKKARSVRELQTSGFTNWTLYSLLQWEAGWLTRRRRLPLGTSLLAIAEPVMGENA